MTNLTEAVELSQKLVVTLYASLSDDVRLQRDRAVFVRLQTPALHLVATLSNANGSIGLSYKQRGISFAKSHLSEFLAILETGRRIGSIDDSHDALYEAAQKVANALKTEE